MSNSIALLRVAAIGAALFGGPALTAGAADYYGGADRPPVYRGDDAFVDGGHARLDRRQDFRSLDRYRGGPGPVVFDERGFDRYGEADERPPVAPRQFGRGRPAAFGPSVERFYGAEAPYAEGAYADGGGYRPAAAIDERDAREGCTVDRARSITATGWEKIVTHRTCYRR